MINANIKYTGKTDLPSYPSEDAVLAGVTAELMKLFFPTEIAFVEQKAADEKESSLASGRNTRSDWTAGEALGRQVATVFAARGRTDRAGAAIGTPAIWAQMEQDCITKGEIPDCESPKRPPSFHYLGKAFLFDSATLVNEIRSPKTLLSQQFKDETAECEVMPIIQPVEMNDRFLMGSDSNTTGTLERYYTESSHKTSAK
jgi:hypothetical protein